MKLQNIKTDKHYRIIDFVAEGQPEIKSNERIVGFSSIYDPEIERIVYSICLEQIKE